MRQLLRRAAVMGFGLAALVFASVGFAPQQVGAVDAFTAAGCQYGDYPCIFARVGYNPNVPQFESPRVIAQQYGYFDYGYNPYFYGIGYNNTYTPNYYGYGATPYYYGGGYAPYYGGYGQYYGGYYGPYYGNGSGITQSTRPNDGFCNLGYGEKGCVSPSR